MNINPLNTPGLDSTKINSETNKNELSKDNIDNPIIDKKNYLKEKIKKIKIFTNSIFKKLFNIFSSDKKDKTIKKYCFTQQYNDSCHLSPIINLKILNNLRENNYETEKLQHLSRRQWLGEDQNMLSAWHKLMGKLNSPDAHESFPYLSRYMQTGIEKGPNSPHFYNQNKEFAFSGLSGFLQFSDTPFFLIELEAMQKTKFNLFITKLDFDVMMKDIKLGVITGIVKDKDVYKIYNSNTKVYDPIDQIHWIELREINGKKEIHFKQDEIDPETRKIYNIPEGNFTVSMQPTTGLGFEEMGINEKIWAGIRSKDSEGNPHTFFPLQQSLLKLMFLATGVDENNREITEGHELYNLYNELKLLMSQDLDNPWHPDKLKKEEILQFHIANMFKQDKELFELAKEAIKIYNPNILSNYEKIRKGDFYDKSGKPLDPTVTKDYILGEEQMVAYYFTSNLRYIWYSSINPKALNTSLEIGISDRFSSLIHIYFKSKFLKKFSIKSDKGSTKTSYLQVWEKIKQKMETVNTTNNRQDYISFDDHGWVISFDPKIIEKQNQSSRMHDLEIIKKLGFAGIESWLSSELNLWYSKQV